MNFRFKCQCGAILNSSREYIGQQIICTECDRRLIVPDAAPKPSVQKVQPTSSSAAPAAKPLAPRQSVLPKTGYQKKTAGGNSTVATAAGIVLCVVALLGATVLGLMSKKSGNSKQQTVAKADQTEPEPAAQPIRVQPSKTFDPSGFAKNESKPIRTKPVVQPPRSSSPFVKSPTTSAPAKKPAGRISPRRNASPRSNAARNKTQEDDPAPGGKSFSIPASIDPPETDFTTQELTKFIDPRFVRLDVKSREGESIGSGFFVTDTGVAVTNYHVVQGARSITVTTIDNEKSKLQGFYYVNPLKDLAVIQINPDEHDFQPLALSATLPQKGERVAAFGSPLGFSFSSSDGLVSSIRSGREIEKSLKDLAGIDIYKHLGFSVSTNWIQTTAAISGGNSGGPLVNMRGQLVGVNTWTNSLGQNLNFASTVDEVRQVMQKASTQRLKPLSRLPSTIVYSKPSRGGIAGGPSGPRVRPGNRPPTMTPEERAAMEERRRGSESIVESTSKSSFKSSKGNAVREYSTDSRVVDMEISKDRKHLSAVTKQGELLVFDLSKGGMLLYSIESEHKLLRQARFSDKPAKMYTLCDSGGQSSVIMRDIKTGEPEQRQVGLDSHRDLDASQMAISSDGRSVFATWVNDRSSGNSSLEEAKFWRFDVLDNKATGWNLERTFGRGSRMPTSAIFSPDNRHLITAFNDGYIVASTGAGNQLGTSGSHQVHSGKIFDIAMTSDGKKIVSGGEDGYLGITAGWKNRKWRPTPLGKPGTEVMSVAVSSDDSLIAASRADNRIEIWSIESRGLLSTIESDSICTDIEFMGRDRFVIAAESDGGVKIYKVSIQK